MAGLSAGPNSFFFVGPDELAKPACFAVKRGDVSERIDPKYHALREVLVSKFPVVQLGTLVQAEPDYGLSSKAVPRTSEHDPRYVRITDFGEDGIEPQHEYVTADPIDLNYELSMNDVLFARSGATVGKTYLHEDIGEPTIFAGYCIRFQFDGTKVSPTFVYWWTKTAAYSRWVAATQRPSGQPNINKEEFKRCPIPLPPSPVQNNLVAAMNVSRVRRKTNLAKARELLAGLDAFVLDKLGIDPLPQDSRQAFAVKTRQTRSQGSLSADFYHPERTAALRSLDAVSQNLEIASIAAVASFERNQMGAPGENYLSLAHVQGHTGELTDSADTASGNCFVFQTGDVLFARLRPYLNKVYYAETGGCCSTEFHVLRVKERMKLLPEYLSAILRSRLILAQTVHMKTGNTHPRLTTDDVANLQIPIPEVEVQETIAAEVVRRREESRRLRTQAEVSWSEAKQWFEQQLLGAAPYEV